MSSSSDIAVRVTGLSKKFRKGEIAHPRSIVDTLNKLNPFRRQYALPQGQKHAGVEKEFWALRDVSFEIPRGEVLGIIGRNGAGKSTLLKVLSQITAPTEGRVEVHGRLGALLEVGTGFHPELTGRENVFMNGAVLGMTRQEIRQEFDSIVDFSGVSEFIDTPVKHYSSGMYMRLAFAVAAHLRNDVLIVDEVLAVGDVEFQKKCLGKMQDVSRSGRTILFVSHNMESMARLCTSILSLKGGRVVEQGRDVQRLISHYLFGPEKASGSLWVAKPEERIKDPNFIPWAIAVVGADGKPLTGGIARGEEAWVVIEGEVVEEDDRLVVGYRLISQTGVSLFASLSADTQAAHWPELKKGRVMLRSRIPTDLLNKGQYHAEIRVGLYGEKWIISTEGEVPRASFDVSLLAWPSPMVNHDRPNLFAPVLAWEKHTGVSLAGPAAAK